MNENNDDLIREMEEYRAGLNSDTAAIREHTDATNESSKQARGIFSRLGSAIGDVTKAAVEYSAAVGEGNTSLKQSGIAVRGLVSAAKEFTDAGSMANTALTALGKSADYYVTQLNRTYEAWQDVSKVGASAADGMTGLVRQATRAGQDIGVWSKSVTESADVLGNFRGTVSAGAEDFAQIVGDLRESNGRMLYKLGYDTEALSKGTAAYIKQQTMLGRTQVQDSKELALGTSNYLMMLKELSQLTGESADELAKKREEDMQNSRFAARINELEMKGQHDVAERFQNFASAMDKAPGDIKRGVLDYMSGNLTTDEAIKARQSFGSTLDTVKSKMEQGLITNDEALRELAVAGKKTADTYTQNAKYVDDASMPITRFADLLKFSNENMTKQDGASRKAVDAQLDSSDELTDRTVDAKMAIEKTNVEMTKLGLKILPVAADAVKGVTESMTTLNEQVNNLGGTIERITGIHVPTPEEASQGLQQFIADHGGRWLSEKVGAVAEKLGLGTTEGRKTSETFKQTAPELLKNLKSDFGLSDAQAAGAIGNLAHESAGLQAGIQEKGVTSGRGGLGWAQWTGSRRRAFEEYLAKTGQNATDPKANYGFLKQELQSPQFRDVIPKLKQAKTAEEATRIWHDAYEKSGDIQHGVIVKPQVYANRERYANEVMKIAQSQSGASAPTQQASTAQPATPTQQASTAQQVANAQPATNRTTTVTQSKEKFSITPANDPFSSQTALAGFNVSDYKSPPITTAQTAEDLGETTPTTPEKPSMLYNAVASVSDWYSKINRTPTAAEMPDMATAGDYGEGAGTDTTGPYSTALASAKESFDNFNKKTPTSADMTIAGDYGENAPAKPTDPTGYYWATGPYERQLELAKENINSIFGSTPEVNQPPVTPTVAASEPTKPETPTVAASEPTKPQTPLPADVSQSTSNLTTPQPKVTAAPAKPDASYGTASAQSAPPGSVVGGDSPEVQSLDKIATLLETQLSKLDNLLSITKTEASNVDKIAKSMA